MVKTTRYCDICHREINQDHDIYYQMKLPARHSEGYFILSHTEQDVCYACFKQLYWKIFDIKPG